MIRLIDPSPIPPGDVIGERARSERIKGMTRHVVYDPGADRPCRIDITPAKVDDLEVGRALAVEPGVGWVSGATRAA